MSSTTVTKPTPQTNDAGPRPGIYLAFIPWIVFTLVAQHSTLKLAAIGALLASVLIAARSARAGGPKLIELGAVLAFVGFTASRLSPTRQRPRSWTATRGRSPPASCP